MLPPEESGRQARGSSSSPLPEDFKVAMGGRWTGRVEPTRAMVSPLLHRVPLLDQRLGAVGVVGHKPVAVVQLHQVAIGPRRPDQITVPLGGGGDGGPGGGRRCRCPGAGWWTRRGPGPRRGEEIPPLQGPEEPALGPSTPWAVPTATWVGGGLGEAVDRHGLPGLLHPLGAGDPVGALLQTGGALLEDLPLPPAGGRRPGPPPPAGLPAGCR